MANITKVRPSIAVLIAAHNRRATTQACLASLLRQDTYADIDIILVDDGSTDGTGEMAKSLIPQLQLVRGSGNLYWNGAMRLAWQQAASSDKTYTHYLWLNDDVALEADALNSLLSDWATVDSQLSIHGTIIAGATRDPSHGFVTYGGQRLTGGVSPIEMAILPPTGVPATCDTFSGNCVLVSAKAYERLGSLSEAYTHIYGDLDYGLFASREGVGVYASSRFVGCCARNGPIGRSHERGISLLERIRRRITEDRSISGRDRRVFVRRHINPRILRCVYYAMPYVRILLHRYHQPFYRQNPEIID